MAILVFGGGFTLLMLAVVLLIDQSFFYPRLQTDALLYFLKAKSLAETGTTAARLAVNLTPFPYASMPGAMRAPLLRMFSDFDDQMRAIQVTNILLTDAIAMMFAYVVSWVVPRSRQWLAIGFVFGFMLLTPWWMANIFFALADAPYAAFSIASLIIAIRIATSPRPLLRPMPIAGFAAAFVLAFLLRYTGPVVLVAFAVLLRARFKERKIPWRVLATATAATIGAVALLIFLNRDAIFGRYLEEPITLLMKGEKQSTILNFFLLAVPEQVIPGFALGFSRTPIIDLFHAQFAATRLDVIWSLVGAGITGVVLLGAWRMRDKMLPEVLMVACVLPLLVVIMPSTSRYFMTYQPFFWLAFYEGVRTIASRIPLAVRKSLVSHAGMLATGALLVGVGVGIRGRAKQEVPSGRSRLAALTDLPAYVHGVSGTYRPLRQFLQRLPRDRSVLTSLSPSLGRFKAIANLDYYAPDSGLTALTKRKDVYLILDCGSADLCARHAEYEDIIKSRLCAVGEFKYELVFEATAEKSGARVFRVRPAT